MTPVRLSVLLIALAPALAGAQPARPTAGSVPVGLKPIPAATRAKLDRREADAATLARVGAQQLEAGNKEAARTTLAKALPLQQAVGNRAARVDAAAKLAQASEARSPRLATLLAKQAARERTQLMVDVAVRDPARLGRATREAHVEERRLLDRLASQGRYAEIRRLTRRVKALEAEALVPDARSLAGGAPQPLSAPLPLTAGEETVARQMDAMSASLARKGERARQLREKGNLTPEEQAELERLERELAEGIAAFEAFLVSLDDPQLAGGEIAADSALKATLARLGPGNVAVFTYVGEQKVVVMLVTREVERAYVARLPPAQLREKVASFRRQLRDPTSDPRPLAEELYGALLGEATADLAAANATTIYWSLDRWLRYVPMAALRHEGAWLAERFRHVVITDESEARLERPTLPEWTVLGLGASEGLPGVREELAKVVRQAPGEPGLLGGERVLDPQFTRASFTERLRHPPPVVHLATHYTFEPVRSADGEFASWIQLGDGSRFTLHDVKLLPGSTLQAVELITLSACETAATLPADVDPALVGAEVDSLATVAQGKGASAVLATLWQVADASTPSLVSQFYRQKAVGKESKAEALRDAQAAFIGGCIGPGKPGPVDCAAPAPGALPAAAAEPPGSSFWNLFSGCGRPPEKPAAPAATTTPAWRGGEPLGPTAGPAAAPSAAFPGWSHPYYWAPFVLLGNGR